MSRQSRRSVPIAVIGPSVVGASGVTAYQVRSCVHCCHRVAITWLMTASRACAIMHTLSVGPRALAVLLAERGLEC